jgi:type II secretory pathway pseudopilin PulG
MLERQTLKFFRSLLAHVSLGSKDYVTAMPKSLFALLLFITLLLFTTQSLSFAQDDAYIEALSTVYGTGISAVFSHEWCDARVPELQTSTAQAFETWQAQHSFLAIEDAIRALMGGSFSALEETFAAGRTEVFALFDEYVSDPVSICQNLLAELNDNYNLRQNFPNEYALIDAKLAASQAETVNPLAETTTPETTTPETTTTPNPLVAGSENPLAETTSIPNVGEMTAGGVLESGDYQCITEYDYRPGWEDMDGTREYVLSLYPDTGLRINENNEDIESIFEYNQATGELTADNNYDILDSVYDDIILNFFYEGYYGDHITSFKFYRDAQHQPVLYGESIADTSEEDIVTTVCRYKGVAQRPSPAEEDAAEIEAARFKYVTAPGQGLQLADIEGIVYREVSYLLLKDGSIYSNLQVPPADLNVADSKKYEAEQWGQWQREGEILKVQWYGTNGFDVLGGFFVQPVQANERLDATYNYISGATIGMPLIGGVTSTSYHSITFTSDGRFEKSGYSTMGSTNTVGLGPNGSLTSNYYSDEEGTVGGTSYSGTVGDTSSGVTVTTESTNPNPPATTGTYTLDGYTLELRYDDGRIERSFFYFWDDKKTNAVIGGLTYSTE